MGATLAKQLFISKVSKFRWKRILATFGFDEFLNNSITLRVQLLLLSLGVEVDGVEHQEEDERGKDQTPKQNPTRKEAEGNHRPSVCGSAINDVTT